MVYRFQVSIPFPSTPPSAVPPPTKTQPTPLHGTTSPELLKGTKVCVLRSSIHF